MVANRQKPILDDAIDRIDNPALRRLIESEVEKLRGSRTFGLLFDRHMPEAVRLPNHPVRKGVTVTLRDESSKDTWTVERFTSTDRAVAVLDDGSERPVRDLVVVRAFGDPVYPGLRSVERIEQAPGQPWHTVINGENYHVLQALKSSHLGNVDLIYIDPPYNTGSDSWIYNDRYVDANDRTRSSKWLSFMERRLLIARDLLKPTGVVIVAIGDDEQHRLRMLLDQVFHPQNFISNIVWQGGRKNDSRYVSNGADYMLVYAKNEEALTQAEIEWREKKPGVDEALDKAAEIWATTNGDHAEATRRWRAWIKDFKRTGVASDSVTRFVSLDANGRPIRTDGNLTSPNPRPNLQYDLLHPRTGKPVPMPPNGWRYSRETMADLVERGLIHFGADETSGVGGISRLEEMNSQVPESVFVRDRNASSARLTEILGDKRFPNPKDPDVLVRWIRLAAPADAVILDFFGGSGTTTEAVLRLNAEDGGTRRSILVTNNEVGSQKAKALRKAGHHPGDPEWDAWGVFEYVTRPRISTVVTGNRPDGSGYSDGLAANVEFFDLHYLDPGMVRRGREFTAIAPLLWLEAGAADECIGEPTESGWALTGRYGVLFDTDATVRFAEAVTKAVLDGADIRVCFVVTDSDTTYERALSRLPQGVPVKRLYEDYLTNFEINTQGGA
jgi:adenine-specific DNA-methyltransferase